MKFHCEHYAIVYYYVCNYHSVVLFLLCILSRTTFMLKKGEL